jgi:hypothetical protein
LEFSLIGNSTACKVEAAASKRTSCLGAGSPIHVNESVKVYGIMDGMAVKEEVMYMTVYIRWRFFRKGVIWGNAPKNNPVVLRNV